ncbi:MAG: AMP-binding protein [Bacteroidota bacterium]
MSWIDILSESIVRHFNRNAFKIGDQYFTYHDLAKSISAIRIAIRENIPEEEKMIGLVANDDLETYAAIIALWFEGKAYVPLNPDAPLSRNFDIIDQADIKTIIDSTPVSQFFSQKIIFSANLVKDEIDLTPKNALNDETCVILFTSGTTGIPKGAQLTYKGIEALLDAFWEIGFDIDDQDKCLQMFHLTFDFAILAYLPPLLKGACFYTIPKSEIKFSYIHELLVEHNLTSIHIVPSILQLLRPYFHEIHLPSLKNCLVSGEALRTDLSEEWSRCAPMAKIFNSYGLTEDTIICTIYPLKRGTTNKSFNGILSLGQPMKGTHVIIIDENGKEMATGEKGELCVSGPQLTPGYLKNESKNKEVFFKTFYNGQEERFYRSGDHCFIDDEGDILYLGRIDFQAKIFGFRVELAEVEYHARKFSGELNLAAIAFQNSGGITELGLVFESPEFNTQHFLQQMKENIEFYMVPSKIKFIEELPKSLNGKIDRNTLVKLFVI